MVVVGKAAAGHLPDCRQPQRDQFRVSSLCVKLRRGGQLRVPWLVKLFQLIAFGGIRLGQVGSLARIGGKVVQSQRVIQKQQFPIARPHGVLWCAVTPIQHFVLARNNADGGECELLVETAQRCSSCADAQGDGAATMPQMTQAFSSENQLDADTNQSCPGCIVAVEFAEIAAHHKARRRVVGVGEIVRVIRIDEEIRVIERP